MTVTTLPAKQSNYARGREALHELRDRHQRTFAMWFDYAMALDDAQKEAMRLANTNHPVGYAYNKHFDAIIFEREHLVIKTAPKPHQQFPDPNTRKDALAMLHNYDQPEDEMRCWSIKYWREQKLDDNERSKLNHPSVIIEHWKRKTDPDTEDEQGTPQQQKHSSAMMRVIALDRYKDKQIAKLQHQLTDSNLIRALRLLIDQGASPQTAGLPTDITRQQLLTLALRIKRLANQMVDGPARIQDETKDDEEEEL